MPVYIMPSAGKLQGKYLGRNWKDVTKWRGKLLLLTWGSECTINLGLSQLILFAASSNTAVADEFSLRPTKNRRQEKRNDRIAVFRLIYIKCQGTRQ